MFWTIVFAILFVMYGIPLILAGICWLFCTKEGWITIGVVASVCVLISIFA